MAIVRWDPWGDFAGIQRDLADLFSRTFGEVRPIPGQRRRNSAFVPPVDVFGRQGNLVVRAELPGVRPEDVEVTFHNGTLLVRGERGHERDIDEGSYHRMESSYGFFERQITLPEGVDGDAITASYSDGILEITVPQVPLVQPKKVPIMEGDRAGSPRRVTVGEPEAASEG
jgi:HSP20 family protein